VRGLKRLVPTDVVQRIVQINGTSGVVSDYPSGQPHSVLTLDVTAGRIRAISVVTNPEKLVHLPADPE
jgi:hypothetical protein